jgi:dephospho-CoA kinase
MKIVGLTGGIGSGKTTVASMFADLGVPIYIADDEAKKLMKSSKVIKRKLVNLFGDRAYLNGALNKPFIANAIFNNKELLEKMNAIIHPKVASHFSKWKLKQNSPYIIKEAAILFENNTYKSFDFIITVTAPEEIRIKRLLQRDNSSLKRIKDIMKNQWTDAEKIKHSNFVIVNNTIDDTERQVVKIHKQIMESL